MMFKYVSVIKQQVFLSFHSLIWGTVEGHSLGLMMVLVQSSPCHHLSL